MRTKFSSELAALTDELAGLAGLAQEATERVAVAVADANLTAAYEVFAIDEQLQQRHGSCENRAVILLALEAPVARDLRHVVSAIQIADDLSQMSWLTSRIADSVVRRYPEPIAPPEILALLGDIGRATVTLTAAARQTIIASTSATGGSPVQADGELAETRQRVLQLVSAGTLDNATTVDLALLVHHYERCAEHCVRIGRLIEFFQTGIPLSAQQNPT